MRLTETPFERPRSGADDSRVLIGEGSTRALDSGQTASQISPGGPADAGAESVGMPVMLATSGAGGYDEQDSGGGPRMTIPGAAAPGRQLSVR
jgi:hypothetical protein